MDNLDVKSRARASKRRSARKRRQLQKDYMANMQHAIQDLARQNEVLASERRTLEHAHTQAVGFVGSAELNDLLIANERLRTQLFVELVNRLSVPQVLMLNKYTGMLDTALLLRQSS